MKQVWTGDTVDAEGPGFEAHGHVALPTPVQVPHPPIWIGGNSQPSARARRRARRRVDSDAGAEEVREGSAIGAARDRSMTCRRMLDAIREEADKLGRDDAGRRDVRTDGDRCRTAPRLRRRRRTSDQVAELTDLGSPAPVCMFSHPGQGSVDVESGSSSISPQASHADVGDRAEHGLRVAWLDARVPPSPPASRRGQPTSDLSPFTLLKWLVQRVRHGDRPRGAIVVLDHRRAVGVERLERSSGTASDRSCPECR